MQYMGASVHVVGDPLDEVRGVLVLDVEHLRARRVNEKCATTVSSLKTRVLQKQPTLFVLSDPQV